MLQCFIVLLPSISIYLPTLWLLLNICIPGKCPALSYHRPLHSLDLLPLLHLSSFRTWLKCHAVFQCTVGMMLFPVCSKMGIIPFVLCWILPQWAELVHVSGPNESVRFLRTGILFLVIPKLSALCTIPGSMISTWQRFAEWLIIFIVSKKPQELTFVKDPPCT